jgi:hypothetical protein
MTLRATQATSTQNPMVAKPISPPITHIADVLMP